MDLRAAPALLRFEVAHRRLEALAAKVILDDLSACVPLIQANSRTRSTGSPRSGWQRRAGVVVEAWRSDRRAVVGSLALRIVVRVVVVLQRADLHIVGATGVAIASVGVQPTRCANKFLAHERCCAAKLGFSPSGFSMPALPA